MTNNSALTGFSITSGRTRSSGDTIKPDEDKNFIKSNDPQMLRAIDALKGVMIYAQQNAPKGESIKK